MAKIYETPADARRDKLVERIKTHNHNMLNAFTGLMGSLGMATLAHQLSKVKTEHLPEGLRSEWFHKTNKFLVGLSLVGAAVDGLIIFSSARNKRKAEDELDCGVSEQIIRLGNGVEAKGFITEYTPGFVLRPEGNVPGTTITAAQEAGALHILEGVFSDKAK